MSLRLLLTSSIRYIPYLARYWTSFFYIAVLKKVRYALCPMPYARRVPHVTEKGYKLLYVNTIDKNFVAAFASVLNGIKPKSQPKINIPKIGKNIGPTEGSTNQANKENKI